ncbi:LexA family transcriptional regulator [Cytobacillus sp. Bac17]|uniref:LexA family protein n=1 Tax=Cytobacillus sp. Bac17 TaxID=2926008 RepID=UPI002117EFD1|nr:S24 family peptidase [Cytobacillus sp. Bac17]
MLQDAIQKNPLSLTEISNQLRNLGFSIDKAYLSRLKNSKIPPASEEINIALSKILSIDLDEFLWASYYEIAPNSLREILKEYKLIDQSVNASMEAVLITLNSLDNFPEEISRFLEEKGFTLKNLSSFLTQFKTKLSVFEKMEVYIALTAKIDINVSLDDDLFEVTVNPLNKVDTVKSIEAFIKSELNREYYQKDVNLSIFCEYKIPIFEKVHGDIFIEEDLITSVSYPEKEEKVAFWVKSYDQGGKELGINKNDLILVDCSKEPLEMDPVLVSINNEPAMVRQIQRINDNLILRPFNNKMKLEVLPSNKVNIIGKIIEVEKRRPI